MIMGNNNSKPSKIVYIGSANYATRGIYALYGLTDKIFPFNINLPRTLSDGALLDKKLEKINIKIAKKIEKNTKIKNMPLEKHPIDLVQEVLSNGKKIEKIFYNQTTHGNHLILCKENIFEINDRIGDLKNLLLLQICCNYVYKIPKSICNLQKLMTLSLARNQIRFIPEEICELGCLTHLDLSYNFISDVPYNFRKLETLTSLHLENNLFNEIPLEISKLKSLRNLQIQNNPIKDIPLQILKMPFLIEFNGSSSTLIYEDKFEKIGNLTLKEVCLRNLVMNTLSIYKSIDRLLMENLLNIEECGFCCGPIFETYFFIKTTECFETKSYPVTYKICRKHFTDEKNKIGAFFSKNHSSIPYKILINHNLSVKDIFNPSVEIKKQYKLFNLFSDKMHLWNLAKFNNPKSKKVLFKKVDEFLYN